MDHQVENSDVATAVELLGTFVGPVLPYVRSAGVGGILSASVERRETDRGSSSQRRQLPRINFFEGALQQRAC